MIYILKTSVKNKKQAKQIAKEFEKLNQIKQWNFDLSDCDKVLKIETDPNHISKVYEILNASNSVCCELK